MLHLTQGTRPARRAYGPRIGSRWYDLVRFDDDPVRLACNDIAPDDVVGVSA